ncbi:kynurenine 3-monooxygenase [Chrysoperla carnea]|uniref:kynurenine 3-monooxygenase n=1 Tax=Chrysoperla carnea TaxID=189513 RepID=UPI001D076391|nr:kynurenine 3-monooxygenase [Chrysoperla carnea]
MESNRNGITKPSKVAIVGGGLVGSLCACFLAKRGLNVELYEYRNDIRKTELVKGRSINLALSNRGRAALRAVGLESHMVREYGIPMAGRMIHKLNGNLQELLYDPRTNKNLYSVGRKYLNEVLLTAAEKYDNVKLFFNHKLINANLQDGKLVFRQMETDQTIELNFDLIIGADGAFSAIRKHMMKMPLFDFSQTYIEHGYMELCIPPDSEGKFQMESNYLHIWPRGEFMMIALPNQDHSWTVTMFMPFAKFAMLDTTEKLMDFFQKNFPDAIPLIGEDRIIKDFFNATALPLVSIKCKPYHVGNRAIIIGDAAHAMVPFYGQGMNAGMEDCLLLDQLLEEYNMNISKVLPEFTRRRHEDAHAICDLAMYNYIEMRDLVNRFTYIIRKKFDDFLFWAFPMYWVPLYNSVSFSTMRYSLCIKNRQWQDKVLKQTSIIVVLFALFFGFLYSILF